MDLSAAAVLLPVLLSFTVAGAAQAPAPPFRTMYAFGDSFTDTGNTHTATGPYSFGYVSEAPYGATFFHRSTNRYSDGRLVVDFLAADALRLPSFLPPYLSTLSSSAAKDSRYYGVNFAVAGATAIEHDFFARNNLSVDITPQSIMTELGWFDAHVKARRGAVLGGRDRRQRLRVQLHGQRQHHPARAHPDHGRRQGHHLPRGAADERGQVRGGAGAAAHGLPASGHDAGAAGGPGQPQLRGLRQRAEPRAQPAPPGGPPPAPEAPPGRRHRIRRLLRRAPRRHAQTGGVRLRGALQGLLRHGRRRIQLRDLLHLRLAGGRHRVRPAGPVRQLGRGPHDGGHVQGRRRHVLPGWLRDVLPPVVRLLAGQERPWQLTT